jgi:hypothetical protein
MAHTYTTHIHKDDLMIFKGLALLLIKFPKMYWVSEESENWLVVSWRGTDLGKTEAIRRRNDEQLDPYKQAERLATGGNILIF